MSQCPYHDPFKKARQEAPVIATEFDGAPVAMILGFKEVKTAARDYETFSSDAPFRVPIPREEDVRTVRQYPLEVDPPVHAEYRKIAEPYFRRPLKADYIERMEALLDELIRDASQRESIEIVREFAIPLQSRALTYLLNMPESEADVWIKWGTHVFRDESGVSKGYEMEAYCNELFDKAEANPGDDFFSALTRAEFQGRKLTRQEMLGFANIAFAGGRDTIINTVATIIAYIGRNPEALDFLREDPKRIPVATEELIRFATPLTHIGRLCPAATDVHGVKVEANKLISLGWASANFDETVFDDPETVKLDRKPNPHIAFGNGIHNCLGAPHARLIVRSLLKKLCELTSSITILEAKPKIEREAAYERHNAYHELRVEVKPRN
ncbi:cytochrome P450 [Haloferula chungangensis]|uniref:Cytochrome P450 n=1 Tax=Haloferula chungangensis TaxID=1048331 RepID=A0ABW2L654_9BACT